MTRAAGAVLRGSRSRQAVPRGPRAPETTVPGGLLAFPSLTGGGLPDRPQIFRNALSYTLQHSYFQSLRCQHFGQTHAIVMSLRAVKLKSTEKQKTRLWDDEQLF